MAWNIGGNTGYGTQNATQGYTQPQTEDREFSWDGDMISNDGSEYILLAPGDYDFTIEKFERSRSNGSDKLPPCNMAVVYFTVHSPQGDVTVRENYLLHTRMEWKLSELFCGAGLKKKGESCPLNFNALPGRSGRLRIKNEQGTGKNAGNTYNRIDKLYPQG